MAAEQRKLLEQLMGRDALDSRRPVRAERIDLYDPKICKSFLLGGCFYDFFPGVKQIGRCPRMHAEKYRLEYLNQVKNGVKFPDFDLEHERTLEHHINELQQRIDVANKRLDKTPEDMEKINQATRDLETLTTAITMSLQEIELLAEQGHITKALQELNNLERLRMEKNNINTEIKALSDVSGFSGFQKLQVCEICSAYLSRLDNDKRLADHFLGKTHRGYALLLDTYNEYKTKNAPLHASSRKRGYSHY
ncbi:Luc7p [Sugiyamaella lignohabitans]|uniref:Luc7p n=1 Tax=Sugiyamaella lignohabitans TaxID=796027 RepID=A0A161HKD4_9ASCO|nr:Luc7p [Sugiyamaella lignohabitans]ANB12108.1 Luc7p [Sugiyamaella lignohabitans]